MPHFHLGLIVDVRVDVRYQRASSFLQVALDASHHLLRVQPLEDQRRHRRDAERRMEHLLGDEQVLFIRFDRLEMLLVQQVLDGGLEYQCNN